MTNSTLITNFTDKGLVQVAFRTQQMNYIAINIRQTKFHD